MRSHLVSHGVIPWHLFYKNGFGGLSETSSDVQKPKLFLPLGHKSFEVFPPDGDLEVLSLTPVE